MESFQQKALDFNELSIDFDPNFVPQDGHEYLQKVVFERTNCPAIVTKPLKPFKRKNPDDPDVSNWNVNNLQPNEIVDAAPEVLLPTDGWNQVQNLQFSRLREKIFQLRIKHNELIVNPDELPSQNISDIWFEYCRTKTPLLSIMLHVPQRTLESLIEHQSNWLTTNTELENIHWLVSWIYASLACLHLPLEPDMHSVLRCIAKTCIQLRNHLTPNDKQIAIPFNLLLCIISSNFNQLDLCGRTIPY